MNSDFSRFEPYVPETPLSTANSKRKRGDGRIMKNLFTPVLMALSLAWSMSTSAQETNEFGVLVMAHGGSPEWNQGVLDTVAPLAGDHTLEVAFGMADAVSLQEAVARLEDRGASRIAVVRLFISGESWYERTEQILGMREGAPARDAEGHAEHMTAADSHAGHTMPTVADKGSATAVMDHSMEFWQIDTDASFALSKPGLAEAQEMGEVLLARASALSRNAAQEDVLILAHGPGDDAENERWLVYIDARAEVIRAAHQFRSVKVATLREDWEEKRAAAEQEVRAFVANSVATSGTAIVIPYRVHSFGPYADVLEGLHYVADEKGLIPHEGVTRWIAAQIKELHAKL
ncbi:MAG: CbiX/SirB N-terminal domain-containing protein [Gammaproteobacteria bacterium]|nr:CbiX/SirB N-terminal domain-containing protein [Gammaproteobacteria bacterium]MDP2141732.1 CbiX/SirB N-terminal domain-containing protein [Gammaproteobacteria bacterium]MDP2347965.1 CbiX/SirB N-terminal domain-containing protein [Gammaproteobacteria bacterium]